MSTNTEQTNAAAQHIQRVCNGLSLVKLDSSTAVFLMTKSEERTKDEAGDRGLADSSLL